MRRAAKRTIAIDFGGDANTERLGAFFDDWISLLENHAQRLRYRGVKESTIRTRIKILVHVSHTLLFACLITTSVAIVWVPWTLLNWIFGIEKESKGD